jgi:hypothetical protein
MGRLTATAELVRIQHTKTYISTAHLCSVDSRAGTPCVTVQDLAGGVVLRRLGKVVPAHTSSPVLNTRHL